MAELSSPLTLFPVSAEIPKVFKHSDFKTVFSFAIIGSIAATALKFVNNARTQDPVLNFTRDKNQKYQSRGLLV